MKATGRSLLKSLEDEEMILEIEVFLGFCGVQQQKCSSEDLWCRLNEHVLVIYVCCCSYVVLVIYEIDKINLRVEFFSYRCL